MEHVDESYRAGTDSGDKGRCCDKL